MTLLDRFEATPTCNCRCHLPDTGSGVTVNHVVACCPRPNGDVDPDVCNQEVGYHSNPHKKCILR